MNFASFDASFDNLQINIWIKLGFCDNLSILYWKHEGSENTYKISRRVFKLISTVTKM